MGKSEGRTHGQPAKYTYGTKGNVKGRVKGKPEGQLRFEALWENVPTVVPTLLCPAHNTVCQIS